METFSAILALCEGNPPVTGGFPSQRPVPRSFDVSLIRAQTNGSANNGDAGDLKRRRAHYGVTVMIRSMYHITARTPASIKCGDKYIQQHYYSHACVCRIVNGLPIFFIIDFSLVGNEETNSRNHLGDHRKRQSDYQALNLQEHTGEETKVTK